MADLLKMSGHLVKSGSHLVKVSDPTACTCCGNCPADAIMSCMNCCGFCDCNLDDEHDVPDEGIYGPVAGFTLYGCAETRTAILTLNGFADPTGATVPGFCSTSFTIVDSCTLLNGTFTAPLWRKCTGEDGDDGESYWAVFPEIDLSYTCGSGPGTTYLFKLRLILELTCSRSGLPDPILHMGFDTSGSGGVYGVTLGDFESLWETDECIADAGDVGGTVSGSSGGWCPWTESTWSAAVE